MPAQTVDLDAIINALDFPVVRINPDDTVAYVNNAFFEYAEIPEIRAGFRDADHLRTLYVGFSIRAYLHPDDVALYESLKERAKRRRFSDAQTSFVVGEKGELRFLSQIGRETPVQLSITYAMSYDQFTLNFIDITERKRMEHALRAEEAVHRERDLLNRLMATSPVGIILAEWTGALTYANPRAEAILGLAKSDITARTYDDPGWKLTAEDGGPFPAEEYPFARVMRTGEPVFDVRYGVELPDGRRVLQSVNGAPLFDEAGAIAEVVFTVEDITERRRAEETLREREAENRERQRILETLIANLPGMVYRCRNDADRTMEYASSECCGLTGYSFEDIVKSARVSYDSLIHADDRKMVRDSIRTALTERRPFEITYRICAADGAEKWVREKGRGVADDRDRIRWIEGFVIDISHERHAAEALRLSEERFRVAIANSRIRVFTTDRDLVYTWVHNPSDVLRDVEYVGRRMGSIAPSPEYAALVRAAEEVVATGVGTRVETTISYGEERQTADTIIEPLRDVAGEVVGIISVSVDITERRAMEDAIRHSEANLRVLLDTIPETVVLLDASGTILMTNEITAERFKHPISALIGADYFIMAPDSVIASRRSHFDRVIATGEPARFEDVRDDRAIYNYMYPVCDAKGAVARVAVLSMDITERKRSEEALRRLATDLARSNIELEQFAYVASHDLQEPLRTIASYTQLLAKRYRGQLDEKADMYIGHAVDGANRMQQLINDLLAYSRVGTRGKPFEPIDTTALLGRVLIDMASSIRTNGALVSNAELPAIMGDRAQLGQVFQNLISNSIKFHGAAAPAIHVAARDDGDAWVFAVHDNGIGIEPEYHERIFELFQRLHTREEYPGTGIGLAVCRKIVERHGGRMWVESTPGTGTTMYFSILKREETEHA